MNPSNPGLGSMTVGGRVATDRKPPTTSTAWPGTFFPHEGNGGKMVARSTR